MSEIPQNSRRWGLDAVRAISALFVFLAHSGNVVIPFQAQLHGSKYPLELMALMDGIAHLGVQLFFALSGFLIGGVLLRDRPTELRSMACFWGRRFLRTYPVFILILGFLSLNQGQSFDVFIKYFFQMAWLPATVSGKFFIVSWTLSVEEWFYVIVPPIFCVLCYRLRWHKVIAIGFILSVLLLVRLIALNDSDPALHRYLTPIHLDGIAWGFLATCLTLTTKQAKLLLIFGIAAIFISLAWRYQLIVENGVITPVPESYNFWGYVMISAGCAALLPLMKSIPSPRNWIAPMLRIVAIVSYPFYLLHTYIIANLSFLYFNEIPEEWRFTWFGPFGLITITLMAALLFSVIIHMIVERPAMAMAARLKYRPTSLSPVANT